MSRSRARDSIATTRGSTPERRASSRWRSRLPGPKAGAIASGGASSEPVGAAAVAVGNDADDPGPQRPEGAVELGGVEQRAVPGQQRHALVAAASAAATPSARRLGVAGVVGVVDRLDAARPRRRPARPARR